MNHEKYVTALEKAGYKGIYSLEYGAPTDDSPLLEQTMKTLEGWLQS